TAEVTTVAVGEGSEDAGFLPVVGDVLHERVVGGQLRTPGVVDDVRPLAGVGVVPGQVGRLEHPLTGGDQGRVGRAAAVRGDPLDPRRDADLVAGAVVTGHGAHRVGAV